MPYRNLAVIALWDLLTGPAGAAYQCLEEGGRLFYQDAPCPASTQGGERNPKVNRTFSRPVLRSATGDPCCITVPETKRLLRSRQPGADDTLSTQPVIS